MKAHGCDSPVESAVSMVADWYSRPGFCDLTTGWMGPHSHDDGRCSVTGEEYSPSSKGGCPKSYWLAPLDRETEVSGDAIDSDLSQFGDMPTMDNSGDGKRWYLQSMDFLCPPRNVSPVRHPITVTSPRYLWVPKYRDPMDEINFFEKVKLAF